MDTVRQCQQFVKLWFAYKCQSCQWSRQIWVTIYYTF